MKWKYNFLFDLTLGILRAKEIVYMAVRFSQKKEDEEVTSC